MFVVASALAQPRLPAHDAELLTPFERDTLGSASYAEAVEFYRVLAQAYPHLCTLQVAGPSDAPEPIYIFLVGKHHQQPSAPDAHVTLINNGIHAGEPCGVDASMMLARDLVLGKAGVDLTNITVAIVPAYNVGGMLRRGQDTRVNQVGPREHGFRANAQNLDLNRDFVKQDSYNARTLSRLMRELNPDIFIDTHTTNGADYQYALTLIATQPEKLGEPLGNYMRQQLLPAIYKGMADQGHLISPYVYSNGVPQEAGIIAFIETPRYSSGYAALHHSLAFITEAHSLKPFATRVRATHAFLTLALQLHNEQYRAIRAARELNKLQTINSDSIVLTWEVDTLRDIMLDFAGYNPVYEKSQITGQQRLRYDREQPVNVATPYYAFAKPVRLVAMPAGYLIPHAYQELIARHLGDVDAYRLREDTTLAVTRYAIVDYKTTSRPYEGHYLHYNVEVAAETLEVLARAGDLLVPIDTQNARLLTALFEPQAPDSYFAWGFFDSWLQQKEYFSSYIFEDIAADMLAKDAELRQLFEQHKAEDESFLTDSDAQLDWLYRQSEYYEGDISYPVLRIER